MFLFFIVVRFLLKDGNVLDSNSNIKISKHEMAWYYIYCENESRILQFFGNEPKNLFLIEKNLYSASLLHHEAEKIKKESNIWIKKIPSSHKTSKSSNHYILMSSSECKIPGILKWSFGVYKMIEFDGNPLILSKIACIRHVDPVKLRNKFASDVQNMSYVHYYDDIINSPISRKHLKGRNQCITVIDSGVDIDNNWFRSNNSKKNSKKIVNVLPYGDSIDDTGHGTFIAGVIAGKPECGEKKGNIGGIAPETKIFVVDIHK